MFLARTSPIAAPGPVRRPSCTCRPVPLWLGGHAEVSLRRVATMGDGWMTLVSPGQARDGEFLERLRRYVAEAGRSPDEVGVEVTVSMAEDLHPGDVPTSRPPEAWAADVAGSRQLGATHLTVNTMGTGLSTADDHIAALSRFLDVVG